MKVEFFDDDPAAGGVEPTPEFDGLTAAEGAQFGFDFGAGGDYLPSLARVGEVVLLGGGGGDRGGDRTPLFNLACKC